MTTYPNTPYTPFPHTMRGTHYQRDEGDYIRFFSVYSLAYDEATINQLKTRRAYEYSIYSEYANLITHWPAEPVYFLYKLETYVIAKAMLPQPDAWLFNEAIEQYEQVGFANLAEFAAFCQQRWGVDLQQFVPLTETDIPG